MTEVLQFDNKVQCWCIKISGAAGRPEKEQHRLLWPEQKKRITWMNLNTVWWMNRNNLTEPVTYRCHSNTWMQLHRPCINMLIFTVSWLGLLLNLLNLSMQIKGVYNMSSKRAGHERERMDEWAACWVYSSGSCLNQVASKQEARQ